ncbi:type IV pilus secretin PilQ [Limnobacter humi]|uniref:Type IV pilus biogenesis and competence protein PilQ n=1 Tax=Limnobacter humi TaxID=1778671 RepID=A0ABT1WCQ5_9BURK|nr:type IV pilus secretin PilQ [Limnobacter humi]MCQ8895308.1 type IV pilus secretin PilQ [Limnobacter humi]
MPTCSIKAIRKTLLLWCCAAGLIWAPAALAATVQRLDLEETPDHTVVTLTFSDGLGKAVRMFQIGNPDRQVIQFLEPIQHAVASPSLPKDSRLSSLQWMDTEGQSRLVIGMNNRYTVTKSDSPTDLKLVFRGPRPFVPGTELGSNLADDSQLKPVVAKALGKQALDRPQSVLLQAASWLTEGESDVLRLDFDRSDVKLDTFIKQDRYRFRFPLVSMAKATGLQPGNSPSGRIGQVQIQTGDEALTLQLRGAGVQHQLRQQGAQLDIVFKPVHVAAEGTNPSVGGAVSGKPTVTPASELNSLLARYTGRPISLDFKEADIRTVLQVFAEFTKMNLVVSDAVQGKVTVHLKDVPWDQALDIVLRSKGLISSQSGNVLLVSNPTDAGADQLEAANRRAQDDMEPLVSRSFLVSYQKTAEVVNIIKSKDSKLLSSRGTILSDERTSQIFIQDTPSRIERIRAIIQSMDKPVKQVMIEAKVVLADTTVSRELGARVRATDSRAKAFGDIGDIFGKKGFIDSGSEAGNVLAYTLYNKASTRLINLQLRALESEDRVRTVSNPRVITSNKEPALIEQGTEIPYQIATSSGATAVEFKQANLKLDVTPQISPDGTILLEVNVSKDSVGVTTANGPAINTRRVKTKVLVSDGGTVVLGGIFEEEDNTKNDKVPGLGDVPLLGQLFKGTTSSKRRAELLIFLTPVVLQDS